jgi:hypothetical protein
MPETTRTTLYIQLVSPRQLPQETPIGHPQSAVQRYLRLFYLKDTQVQRMKLYPTHSLAAIQ